MVDSRISATAQVPVPPHPTPPHPTLLPAIPRRSTQLTLPVLPWAVPTLPWPPPGPAPVVVYKDQKPLVMWKEEALYVPYICIRVYIH